MGFIESHTAVETLVVTNNALTDEALVCLTGCHRLKHIYLGNNQIQSMRVKQSVKELKERFTIFL